MRVVFVVEMDIDMEDDYEAFHVAATEIGHALEQVEPQPLRTTVAIQEKAAQLTDLMNEWQGERQEQ